MATADVVMTLAQTQPVCAVTSSWLQEFDAAIDLPTKIEVYVSSVKGIPGTLLGVTPSPQVSSVNQLATIRVQGISPIAGRYVTIRVVALTGWSFTDEMTVLGPRG